MSTSTPVPSLAPGCFFGNSGTRVSTPAFDFTTLDATVPERAVPRHTHDAPHFVLVLSGLYITEARNQPGLCPPGTLIFNPGGTTHRDRFQSSAGRFLTINPSPDAWQMLESAAPVSLVAGGSPAALAAALRRELNLGQDLSAPLVESLGLELAAVLGSQFSPTHSRRAPDWLARTKDLMERDGTDELSVSRLAASAGVHPIYLARAFRRHFGCAPAEYLRRRRLLHAQRLLGESRLELAAIALDCGFADQSQMTRLFTRAFGMPPGRYRRLLHR